MAITTKTRTIRIPKTLDRAIQDEAQRRGVTPNAVIASALIATIEADEEKAGVSEAPATS